jgi:hypothetical protein
LLRRRLGLKELRFVISAAVLLFQKRSKSVIAEAWIRSFLESAGFASQKTGLKRAEVCDFSRSSSFPEKKQKR